MPDDTKQMDFDDKPTHAREEEEPKPATAGNEEIEDEDLGDEDDEDFLDDDDVLTDEPGSHKDLDRDRQNP